MIEEGECKVTPGGELDEWLSWCESYAARIDPLTSLRHEIARVKAEHPADCPTCGGDSPNSSGGSSWTDEAN